MTVPLYKVPTRKWPSNEPIPAGLGKRSIPRPLIEVDFEFLEQEMEEEFFEEISAIVEQWDFSSGVPFLIRDKDNKLRPGPYLQEVKE